MRLNYNVIRLKLTPRARARANHRARAARA